MYIHHNGAEKNLEKYSYCSRFEDVGEEENFRPRVHSMEKISRAKIKSVKQTIVIIVSYILCSTPAVGLQLWTVWVEKGEKFGKSHQKITKKFKSHSYEF